MSLFSFVKLIGYHSTYIITVSFVNYWQYALLHRFGITQSTPAEEDEKKKARLSKFGSSSTVDLLEEEKKKARAIRYVLN